MTGEITVVKIEAHGHLGDFSEEYFLRPGQEWLTAARAMREFLSYVRKGWEQRMAELFKALDELERIERGEAISPYWSSTGRRQ